jgi:bacterioferritin
MSSGLRLVTTPMCHDHRAPDSRKQRMGTRRTNIRTTKEDGMATQSQPAMRPAQRGILAEDRAEQRDHLLELLQKAYFMELETVMNYVTNSINPDGVRAQEIKESLQQDINEELLHAQQFGNRIKELYGVVPASMAFTAAQQGLQPPEQQTDVVHVIKGVIEAETAAIEHYNEIIEYTEGIDPVTNDMVIDILRDEEQHRRLFEGFLREYQAQGMA